MISSRDILQGVDALSPRRCDAPNRDGEGSRLHLGNVTNGTAERVYVASPITTYQTPRYDQKLAEIAQHFPRAELLQARCLFRSTADWRRRWPQLLPTLTGLVFFANSDRTVGLGVWSEVQDAVDRIPVWFLDDGNGWYALDDFAVQVTGESYARFATVNIADSPDFPSVVGCASPKGGA
jgi:hypothetical protein